MNTVNHKGEKGQAIVYLVLGLVVFLGFVALAIDGGMVLADRRHDQNAADAASLAGGAEGALYIQQHRSSMCGWAWSCGNADVTTARGIAVNSAIGRAGENGFTIDDNISDHNGVNTFCNDTGGKNNYVDVLVQIASTTPSNFLQLLSTDALTNEVEAVTRINPGGPVAFGNAVVALNPEHCSDPGSQGLIVGGSGIVSVVGGDMFSNGCLRQNGTAMTVTIQSPYQAMGHQLFKITSKNWNTEPIKTEKTIYPEDYEITPPNCNDPAAHHITGADLEKSLPRTLESGLWCISGNLKINQNPAQPNTPVLVAPDVTFVMENGSLIINGPAYVKLDAPDNTGDPYPALPGILIYLPNTNSNVVTLNGTQESVITGFIYAPKSNVTLSGTGGNTYIYTQVLGWNVEFTGDSDLNLLYSGCQGYIRPPKIELYK